MINQNQYPRVRTTKPLTEILRIAISVLINIIFLGLVILSWYHYFSISSINQVDKAMIFVLNALLTGLYIHFVVNQ